MPIGKLEPFNVNSKQWPAYIRRVNQYIVLNEISDVLKVPMLITVVGEATYALMCDLCSPDFPEKKTYDELVKMVTDHLEPQRSEIAERHVFRLRRQRVGESLTEYLQDLKHLATTCNFTSSTLEENLRDQFVSGLANDAMRSRIFAEKKIKYKEAVELALALEAAEKHAEVSGARVVQTSGAGGEAGEGLHQARTGRGPRARGGGAGGSSGAARPAQAQPQPCWRCGRAHRADRCRFSNYNCDECNQKGHLKVMCKKGRGSGGRAFGNNNYVGEDTDEDDLFDIEVTVQDHIREFSCGSLFYRTLYMNEERNTLYVGAMDRVFKLNMSDISQSHCERDAILLEASNVARCVSKGKSEPFECRNHIRVLQPLGDGERLYVCGTNAHSPKDWVVYLNLTHLPRHEYVPGVGLGVAKCPYDPADNSTAVWITKGNPGSLPALYAGTNAEFTKADPVIFRNDLFDLRTGQKKYNFKRTLKYDSKWLDKTNFVGSFDVGEYVLFFFRETAVEFMNCGKAVYSRVARVCKHDTGGKHILSQNWATYLKARLNCSIPGEFPFYFDEIQSVYQMPDDPTRFYAAFATGASDGLVGSAICTYTMDDIQDAFAGRFKEQATSSSAWLPVLRARVPEPRPGTCVNNTEALPDNVLNFIRSHPLMDSAVRHEGDAPAFYKRDLVLTTLVVDRQFVDMLGDDITYTVFYAGTSAGEVYKIVQWAGGGSRVADVWRASGTEPVRALALSRKVHALYLATDNRLRQLPLRACTHRYDSCVRCVLDPYCGWDKEVGACRPYTPGLLHDATNSTPSICEASAPQRTVRAGYGQSVHLAAFGKTPEALKDQQVTWYHHSREKGRYKINFNWERVLETSERGLVLLSVTETDRGRYECYFGPTLIASYNLDIDIHRCTQPSKSQEYKQVYSDWCFEFEKYKSAMKAWESRQMQCSKSLNASSQQNSMANEIVASLR